MALYLLMNSHDLSPGWAWSMRPRALLLLFSTSTLGFSYHFSLYNTRIFRTIVIICRRRLVLLYGYHRFVIQFFSRFDSDKSGFISFAEFAVAGPSARDVEEETAVLQPQWDALSEVLSCDHPSG